MKLNSFEVFRKQFDLIRSRYKFYVLEGRSQTGKSVWSSWCMGDPSNVFYVNCAHCPEPDLREFEPLVHKVILMVEASPMMVINQKLLMQCPPQYIKLGQSGTNCHAYDVIVTGIMMFICSNSWISDVLKMGKLEDQQWIQDNSIVANIVSNKLWHEDPPQDFPNGGATVTVDGWELSQLGQ